MKILMINKFLHPNGGSETYVFNLGAYLASAGHSVEYFGMEHPQRCVGNTAGAYTSNMDFHGGSKLKKLTYPLKTIYSTEARVQIRKVLDDFAPDVCHLNNFNYQLTPSIILEIRKWEKETGRKCKIVYTAHDLQLVCPNHLCRNPVTGDICENCLGGKFINCVKGKCIHGSLAKSVVGAAEAYFWNMNGVYKQIDTIICCSNFLKTELDTNPVLAQRTVAMHNFIETAPYKQVEKGDYVLYLGRFSKEKGITSMVRAAEKLPHIPFIFAGSGPLEEMVNNIPNVKNAGFQTGEGLENLYRQARFTVVPSECYENCPFTVIESQMYGTPVLGADIGGIPELISVDKTGLLFESGNVNALTQAIDSLWKDTEKLAQYTENCKTSTHITAESYGQWLINNCYIN